MRIVLAVVALLLAAPLSASAQAAPYSNDPQLRVPSTELAPAAAPEAQPIATAPARAESRSEAPRDDRRDQIAQRGSFWWLVGVIVVAGVLLAVLLD